MATQVAAGAWGPDSGRGRAGDGDPLDLALQAAALVAALEQALLATHRLLDALGTSAGCHAEASGHPPGAGARGRAGAACNGPAGAHGAGRAGGLSRREAEVLGLLAAGLSNRQSAQALFISPRTVQRHVANIYLKIGAHCRAEATAHALRHGLA